MHWSNKIMICNKETAVVIFLVIFAAVPCSCILQCTLMTSVQGSNFQLNQEAVGGIQFEYGQNSNAFSALDCYCNPRSDSISIDYHTSTNVFDRDSTLFPYWRNASLFHLHDCASVQLSLNIGTNGELATAMAGAAMVVDNVDSLALQAFQAGDIAISTNTYLNQQQTFSSFYFRNVVFSQLPANNLLKVTEKAEFLLQNVTLSSANNGPTSLALQVSNQNNTITPALRVIGCTFPPPADVSLGLGTTSGSFTATVTNKQYRFDINWPGNVGCYLDYKGIVEIRQNSFGALTGYTLDVAGSASVIFSNNVVQMSASNALTFYNVESLVMQSNIFGFAFSLPLITSTYVATTSSNRCSGYSGAPDLPSSSDTALTISGNALPSVSSALLTIIKDGTYNTTFISDKLNADGNTVSAICNCNTNSIGLGYNLTLPYNPTDTQRTMQKLLGGSKCTVFLKATLAVGNWKDVCSLGQSGSALTPAQILAQQCGSTLGDEERRWWIVWVAVAAGGSFLITAIVVGCLCKCCSTWKIRPAK